VCAPSPELRLVIDAWVFNRGRVEGAGMREMSTSKCDVAADDGE